MALITIMTAVRGGGGTYIMRVTPRTLRLPASCFHRFRSNEVRLVAERDLAETVATKSINEAVRDGEALAQSPGN